LASDTFDAGLAAVVFFACAFISRFFGTGAGTTYLGSFAGDFFATFAGDFKAATLTATLAFETLALFD
jgi:hypothetical protein